LIRSFVRSGKSAKRNSYDGQVDHACHESTADDAEDSVLPTSSGHADKLVSSDPRKFRDADDDSVPAFSRVSRWPGMLAAAIRRATIGATDKPDNATAESLQTIELSILEIVLRNGFAKRPLDRAAGRRPVVELDRAKRIEIDAILDSERGCASFAKRNRSQIRGWPGK